MPDPTNPTTENPPAGAAPATRTKDEVALELMKFIASSTGYGKVSAAVGFSGKSAKTPEEYADALLELYQRCRKVVGDE